MTIPATMAARGRRGSETVGQSPEELKELVSHVGAELELAPAQDIIEWAVATFGDRFCITSSMADAVLGHLASSVHPGIDVVFLDTGYHFAETIGTRDAVQATMPVNLLSITPAQTVAEQDATYGKDLYARDPDLCCALRKVKPLEEALSGYTAWISGLRRVEAVTRRDAQAVYGSSARASGSTLRSAQQAPGSRRQSSAPCWASCSATDCTGVMVSRLTGMVAATASRVPIVSTKW